MNKHFTYKIFNDFHELLEKDWTNLENEQKVYFFQKYSFAKNLADLYDKKNLYNVVIYYQNKVIAIFPLQIRVLNRVRILQWLGSNLIDYCCPIISSNNFFDEKNFKKIWNEILDEINFYDIIYLNKQPATIFKKLNPFTKFLKNNYHSKVFLIQLDGKSNNYLSLIKNKKFVSELKRTKKKLFESNKVVFEEPKFEAKKNLIKKIIETKTSNLKEKNITHSFDNKFIEFYENFNILNPEKLLVTTLKINEELIAANIGIIDNNKFFYFMPVLFTKKFRSFSPGKQLIIYLIDWSNKNNIKIFDFGLGEENYKKYWSNYSINLYRYISFRRIKGLVIFLAIKIYFRLKETLRRFSS